MSKENGGSAFPTHDADIGTDPRHGVLTGGMSLRDYFAASAVTGIISRINGKSVELDIAKYAYVIADAMLKERQQ